MKWKQKTYLWIGIVIIVAMGIYPPWVFPVRGANIEAETDFGYRWLWTPPEGGIRTGSQKAVLTHGHINFRRLFVQWGMVALVTGGLIVSFKNEKPKDEQKQ